MLDELLIAIGSGKAISLNDITEACLDVNALGSRVDRTVLMASAFAGNVCLIKDLLEFGVDVNATNRYGVTALHEAAGVGHIETIKLLVSSNANIESETRYGETALMLAAAHGELDAVKTLLDLGADILHSDAAGATAEVIAESKDEDEVLALLRKAKGGGELPD